MSDRSGVNLARLPTIRTSPASIVDRFRSIFTAANFFGPPDLIGESVAQQESSDGSGIVVAVLDSGCLRSHVALSGRVLDGRNFTAIGGDVGDTIGHGTAVAGLVAAKSVAPVIAPGARILPLKIFDGPGQNDMRILDDALAWLLTDPQAAEVSVVCLSMGDDGNYRTVGEIPTDGGGVRHDVADKIRKLRERRIPVVTAAGNGYRRDGATAGVGMCFPAIMPECISVGAAFVSTLGDMTFTDYGDASIVDSTPRQLAPFSQRLSATMDGVHFTRLFAPGAAIRSLSIIGNAGATDPLFGTSVAVPIVAGVISLMQGWHKKTFGMLPDCDQIERWLLQGSTTIVDNAGLRDNVDNTGAAFQYLNARDAVRAMKTELVA